MSNKYLWTDNEWTFEIIKETDMAIEKIAVDEFGLDVYRNQIEVITSEQMLAAYSSVGMPIQYEHWSHGKQFVREAKAYKRGAMGLAYEIVINSNPCIAYLMEENTMTMQALVIAHACYGHNSFFKGNYLFQQWTDADSIVDYMIFARNYIRQCEEKHGVEAVEEILDSCHALMNHGVDRYTKPKRLSLEKEKERQDRREAYRQEMVNDIWKTLPPTAKETKKEKDRFPKEPTENLLHFIEKNAPLLKSWQREVIRIVRKISQYFYPQRQTQVMNEGWASFWHHHLMNELVNRELITEGAWLEFIQSHTNVISQPPWDSKMFSGINVYALGYNIYRDIKRMCIDPTPEDKEWFPDIVGGDWNETITFAMKNFKDESFILQFLSPKVIRDLKLFSVGDNEKNQYNYLVNNIHDDDGYKRIRTHLSNQYNLSRRDPDIQVYKVDKDGDRTLYLRHFRYNNIPLGTDTAEVLKHLYRLWGFNVILESVDASGKIIKTHRAIKKEEVKPEETKEEKKS